MSASSQNQGVTNRYTDKGYFISSEIEQKLNLLLHVTENSDRLALIKGADNSGKSSFVEQLISQAPTNWLICRIDANPLLHPDQLFNRLGECFDVVIKADALDLLIQRFEYLQMAGKLPVVIVDDAHLLPTATVIALFRLFERRVQSAPLVKILLFAAPAMDAYLKTPQMQAMNLQLLQIMEMPALNKEETEAFATFLGVRSGSKLKLNVSELDRLYRETKGNLGEIKKAVTLMQKQPGSNSNDVETPAVANKKPMLPILGGGLVVILLVLALVFQNSINALFDGDKTPEVALQTHEIKPPEPIVPITVPSDEEPVAEEIEEAHESQMPAETGERVVVPVSLPELVREVEPPVVEEIENKVEVVESPEAVVSPIIQQAEALPPPPVEPVVEASSTGRVTLESNKANVGVDQQSPESQESVLESADTDKKPELQNRPVSHASAYTAAEQSLLSEKAGSYTLQLIGVHESKAAEAFITRNNLGDQAKYFRTTMKGRDWYSVVYGVYRTRGEAEQAKKTLPSTLKIKDIWPRTLGSVQEAIKSRN